MQETLLEVCADCFWQASCGIRLSNKAQDDCKYKVTKVELRERGLLPNEVQ